MYAPEYTTKEKWVLVCKHLAWAIPLVVIAKFWFFPWFERFSSNAHCYHFTWVGFGDFTGVHLVSYGMFVGYPLILALMLFLFEGYRNIKIIQLGQTPLPNEKVLKPTKYTYGLKAKIKSYLFFTMLLFLLGVASWGFFAAKDILSNAEKKQEVSCSVMTQ